MRGSIHFLCILGCKCVEREVEGSLPNIRMKAISLECLFGKKLYAAQAKLSMLPHSKD